MILNNYRGLPPGKPPRTSSGISLGDPPGMFLGGRETPSKGPPLGITLGDTQADTLGDTVGCTLGGTLGAGRGDTLGDPLGIDWGIAWAHPGSILNRFCFGFGIILGRDFRRASCRRSSARGASFSMLGGEYRMIDDLQDDPSVKPIKSSS